MLPGILNGFDLTEHFKSDLTTSHIPVILLTALSSEEQKIIGLEKGADVYLTKPFHLRELKAHLKSLLHSRETMKKKFREHAFLGTKELKISNQDKQFIQRVIQVIESNISNPDFAVPDLCNALNINHNKLYRKIRSLTDMTIKDFIQGIKLKTAAQLLIESDKNISEMAYEVGFSDPNYFGKCFKSQFGNFFQFFNFVPHSGATYCFHNLIPAFTLVNYLNANASGAVSFLSNKHIVKFGTPKSTKHIMIIK